MSRSSMINEEDSRLFRGAVTGTRVLEQDGIAPHRDPPAPVVRPQSDKQKRQQVPYTVETGKELSFARDGVSAKRVSRLRQGKYPISKRLDLHGLNVSQALQKVDQFIEQCRQDGMRCVLVIHGKGKHSSSREPVLKGELNGWLRQCEGVLAFVSAHPCDGGNGAIYLLLKRVRT